jgi:hypothetical protein
VKRLLSASLVVALLLLGPGCGNVFVRGAINFSTISGFVSIVQLTTVIDDGSSVLVTFVTFLQQGTSTTMGFCGDQTSQFPLNQMVTTNFNPGQPCATLIVVIIID